MFLDNLKQTYTESKWYSKVQGFSFDDMITSSNRFFNPDNFNTALPESRKAEYAEWAKVNVTDSGKDYDYVGAFLAGEGRGLSDNGHLTDRWKKPNHPTFSKDSVYAVGAYKKYAGTWKQQKDSSWTYTPSRATSKAVNAYIKQNRS
jgi:hypothetical protein